MRNCLATHYYDKSNFTYFVVLNNWKIAVIVVAIFVFLLMVIIIIAIVRMYRRRHYTGKAYVSEQGRDNTGANLS